MPYFSISQKYPSPTGFDASFKRWANGLPLGTIRGEIEGGNYPIGGAQGNPYGTLMGRPIIVTQHAPAFTSQGDLSLVDFSFYRTITKVGGVQMDQSMHLYFDADATAFRATFRLDGGSKIVAPISQAKGSKTLSPFVQLAAR